MSICWYCHWGWAKPVVAVYQEAVEKLNGNDWPLKFGSSHIVWEDENFYDVHIQACLDDPGDDVQERGEYAAEIIRWSLEELLKIPESERIPVPDDYDGVDPASFHPTVPVERVR